MELLACRLSPMKSRILTFCVLFPAFALAQQRPKKSSPPNIFLITIDTFRTDHVYRYGYEKIQIPALDSLASEPHRAASRQFQRRRAGSGGRQIQAKCASKYAPQKGTSGYSPMVSANPSGTFSK
jgi:hypothetical protein